MSADHEAGSSMFDEVGDLYQRVILDRGRHPRHAGRLADFDATGKGDNPMCGDRVQVWVKHDHAGKVGEVGFEARGCAICVASADLMAEAVIGRDRPALHALAEEFEAMVRGGDSGGSEALEPLKPLGGVSEFPSRIKCATLPWQALMSALDEAAQTEAGNG